MNNSGQGGIADTLTPITPMCQHKETAAGLLRLNRTAIKARSHNYKGSVMPLQSRDNDIVAPCTYIWGTRASPTPDKTTYMGDGASPAPINCVRLADTLLHKPYKITK